MRRRLAMDWHDDMIWWGPAGIGATYTIERYVRQHSTPFRDALPATGSTATSPKSPKRFRRLLRLGQPHLAQRGGYMGMTGGRARRHAGDRHVPRRGRQARRELDLHRHPALPQHAGLDVLKRMEAVQSGGG
jgi:hypothetical protein